MKNNDLFFGIGDFVKSGTTQEGWIVLTILGGEFCLHIRSLKIPKIVKKLKSMWNIARNGGNIGVFLIRNVNKKNN